ncbi:D-alanine-D-alanine ligase-like ATP-grasp enzyme [Paenibacillus castaneae]|uniref:YheC/YheD family protein n=1 Tax=Paenibacillus castaneae TaxID=474957 RepID=UPI000C9C278C|nr:YheC/YheD family protein [Paenibacillus castaneae]NIK78212.1 D-alanine-D-alanine ligase-like ATP-grasp enzyme [Paenibacillus castaneae]
MRTTRVNSAGRSDRGRRAWDKWTKTKVLEGDHLLRRHLPVTRVMTKRSLEKMLEMYKMVYVKPINGAQGRGVMKVEKISYKRGGVNKQAYVYQLNEKRLSFTTYESAYRSIVKDTKGEVYIVQKGIRLLKHNRRPFDIRLVVQRSPHGGWEATGTVGRAAHPRKIVTNGSQGGTIYPTAYLLKHYTTAAKRKQMLGEMDRLGVHTAKRLHRAYPVIKEIGVDLAIDSSLKPWILEVNTIPDPCPFALLPDQSMLRKIIRYGKAYGKTYRLVCKKAKRGL